MNKLRQLSQIILLVICLLSSTPCLAEDTPSVTLTPEEQQWLKEHPVIRLAPDPDFKPIEYFDKNGNYLGAAADMIRILEKKLGIKITVVQLKNWDEAMEKFKNHEVDLLGAMVRTANREKFALFTNTLVSVPGGILTRDEKLENLSLKTLKGLKVAVVSNYAAHDIIRNQYPDVTLHVVPDVSTGLAKASLGMVDVYVENMANAVFYTHEAGITNLRLAGKTEFDYKWGIGIRKDWPIFQGILNKGLAAISEEERSQALGKWIYIEGQKWRPTKTFIAGLVASVLAILLFMTAHWNYTLKKVVRSRTKSLQTELEERQKAEESLRIMAGHLEDLVRDRTAELETEIRRRQVLFEQSPDGIVIVDPKTAGFIEFNTAAHQQLGYSREEFGTLTIHDIEVKESFEETKARIAEVMQKGRVDFDTLQRTKQGEVRNVHVTAQTMLITNQLIYLCIWRDITERKREERKFRESEAKYSRLYGSMTDAFAQVDMAGRIRESNPAFQELTGYSNVELQNMKYSDLTPSSWHAKEEAILREYVLVRGYSDVYEKEYIRKDGAILAVELRTFLMRDENEQPIGMWAIVRDITERKQAEAEIRRTMHRFTSLFESMIEGVALHSMVRSADGKAINYRIVEVNPAYERILGLPRQQAVGKLATEIYPVDSPPFLLEFDKVVDTKEYLNFETYYPPMDKHFSISVIPWELDGFATIFTDITESKRVDEERISLQKQLLHTQKLESLGVLAGGIAHDFNNILTAIVGNAELALMRLNPESPVLDNLKRIEHAASRASDLAKQMLAYSGKGQFVIESIDLNRLVEEMGHMLEVSISKKAILRYNLTTPLPAVNVDATQIRQIIMNLVINASEAIGDKSGVIAIATGCLECNEAYLQEVWLTDPIAEGLYVYLEVSDSGCGMSKETQERLFDPFFTTKFTGRGLGMAAVLGIVRGHKGAIKVYSEVNKGSSFKILLPAGERPAELFNDSSHDETWKGCGVALLVDDEETVLAIGSEMLRELGFEVITASDGRKAVEMYQTRPDICLVILDLTMPHMDGEQCFRELRMFDPNVKVIMSSGFSEHEVVQKFSGKGLAGFVQKPYKMSTLRNVLRSSGTG